MRTTGTEATRPHARDTRARVLRGFKRVLATRVRVEVSTVQPSFPRNYGNRSAHDARVVSSGGFGRSSLTTTPEQQAYGWPAPGDGF